MFVGSKCGICGMSLKSTEHPVRLREVKRALTRHDLQVESLEQFEKCYHVFHGYCLRTKSFDNQNAIFTCSVCYPNGADGHHTSNKTWVIMQKTLRELQLHSTQEKIESDWIVWLYDHVVSSEG